VLGTVLISLRAEDEDGVRRYVHGQEEEYEDVRWSTITRT
jgi:hypothetical protein